MFCAMDEYEIRLACLKIAAEKCSGSADALVKEAQKLEAYILGRPATASTGLKVA